MVRRRQRAVEASWQSRLIRTELGKEIRATRVGAGLSLAAAGAAVGMSHSQFGRIERAELEGVTIEQLCLACAAVGQKLVVRAYPDGDPVRDRAQLGVLRRFGEHVPRSVRVIDEAPMPIPGDRRAWDQLLLLDPYPTAVEAESRLRDLQALQRRVTLKQRDSGLERVILLVNDTASNRRALALHREDLRANFPLDGRAVLAAIAAGRSPPANGIVVL